MNAHSAPRHLFAISNERVMSLLTAQFAKLRASRKNNTAKKRQGGALHDNEH
jgi:hypothetical protein